MDNLSFCEYKKLVNYYLKKDSRELNFQNRIICLLLENVLKNEETISVVDISTQFKNKESKIHTRSGYAKKYTPDLLIAKNWNYENKNNDPNRIYIAVVEVKSPYKSMSKNNYTGKELGNKHTCDEINEYLSNNLKVILTDCHEWKFYVKDNKNDIIIKTFNFSEELLKEDLYIQGLPKWEKLLEYLNEFLIGKEV